MNRAYSVLNIKATQDSGGKRTFSGIASTPSTDRMGDVVEPRGAQFKLPIPLLWQHDSRQPIGWVTAAKVTDKGIEVEGEIASVEEDGPLKLRLTEAWQMLKSKLVRGLSIGFNSIESARIDGTYGLKFIKWEWLELSAVTIAANQDASITAIKSADAALLAASGRGQRDGGRQDPPGASGNRKAASSGNPSTRSPKGEIMKTIAELREERETKAARQREMLDLKKSENRRFTADEAKEFDDLSDELDDLDDEIRTKNFEGRTAAAPRVVRGANADEGSRSRGPTVLVRSGDKDEEFKGQNFVRQIIARTIAQKTYADPVAIAKARWGKVAPTLIKLMQAKAAVPGGGSESGEWGAELTDADTRFTGDFIEFLYGMTVYDRLGLTEIPDNVQIKGQDGASTAFWVGESRGIPVTTADFMNVELRSMKVAAIAVASNELLMRSTPSAERLIANSIREAAAQRIDTTFISASAAVSGVSPAGILNGVTPTTWATGTDQAAVIAMVKALYGSFITAKNASGLTFVMNPSTAKAIGLIMNGLGLPAFPGLNADGGTLLGDRVITGDNVDPSDVILLKPSDIYRIGDGGVEVEMSREAMIEQDSAPTGRTDTPVAATANFTSMFQEDSTALRVIRRTNFAKRRASAVAWVNNADFDGVVS